MVRYVTSITTAFLVLGGCGPRLPSNEPERSGSARSQPEGCTSNADCPNGVCQGEQGCDSIWRCGPPQACGAAITEFCGCDGVTYQSGSTCAPRPYQYRGRCEDGPPDPVEGRACESHGDCPGGYSCLALAGCTSPPWCQRSECSDVETTYCDCFRQTRVNNDTCIDGGFLHLGPCETPP